MNRTWRISGNFPKVGEVAVSVTAPNWQGAIRKGALALKRCELLKGRKVKAASFMLEERAMDSPRLQGEQLDLQESGTEGQTPEPTVAESKGSD